MLLADTGAKTVLIPFHADRQLDYEKQIFFRGGYLFLQSIYYQMHMDKICRKLKLQYKFKYDINAIHLMNFMMFIVHWMFLALNVISYNQKFIKTVFF